MLLTSLTHHLMLLGERLWVQPVAHGRGTQTMIWLLQDVVHLTHISIAVRALLPLLRMLVGAFG